MTLNSVADAIEPAHQYYCSSPRYDIARVKWDVPGPRWLIPYPFRKGKERYEWRAGDRDECTGEAYNGRWWYKP